MYPQQQPSLVTLLEISSPEIIHQNIDYIKPNSSKEISHYKLALHKKFTRRGPILRD